MSWFKNISLGLIKWLGCNSRKNAPELVNREAAAPLHATARDLPPELFSHILKFVVSTDTWAPPEGPWTTYLSQIWMTKRELGMWALTCRYWNERCQPLIFDTIRLRSRSDVHDLIAFIKREDSKIAQYIRSVVVEQTGTGQPWVHLVEMMLSPVIEQHRRGSKHLSWLRELKLDTPFSLQLERRIRIRSINAALPQSPPTSLADIGRLHLSNIAFHRFEDLMRLVAELPHLHEVRGHKLTWADKPESRPPQSKGRLLSSVTMTECTNKWAPVWLMTGPTWPRPSFVYRTYEEHMFKPNEMAAMTGICRVISDGVDSETQPLAATIVQNATYSSTNATEYQTVIEASPPNPQVTLAPKVTFSCAAPGKRDPDGICYPHIEAITLDFRDISPVQNVRACKWKDVDERIAGLTALNKVVFGFSSPEDLELFDKDVLESLMPRLRGSEKLVLVVANRGPSRNKGVLWLAASRDEETSGFIYSERDGRLLLHDLSPQSSEQ